MIEWTPILADVLTGAAFDQAVGRLSAIRDWTRNRAHQDMVSQYLDAESARMHPLVYAYIDKYSSEPKDRMLRKRLPSGDLRIPVSVATRGPVKLGQLVVPIARDASWKSNEYVKIRQAIGGEVWDNECFSARSMRFDDSGVLVLGGGLTTYGAALAHHDSLEWELLIEASKIIARRDQQLPRLDRMLPLRREVTGRIRHGATAGTGSFSAISVSTLLVYNDAGTYKVMVGKRSGRTGAHADLFHVIPACMHQPELGSAIEEWDIQHTVLKEYAEELFNETLRKNAQNYKYFYRTSRPVASLLAAIRRGSCTLSTTGLIINQLNFRPEICMLLLVRDPDWWEAESAMMQHNWEYVNRQELLRLASTQDKYWTDLRLDDVEFQFNEFFGTSPAMWVPSGLAALWLGVDAARRDLREKITSWPLAPLG
jgi:hypothetical protein